LIAQRVRGGNAVTLNEILAELKLTDELLQAAPKDEQPAARAAMAATSRELKLLLVQIQVMLLKASFEPAPELVATEYFQLPSLRHELELAIQDQQKRTVIVNKIVTIGRRALLGLGGTEDFPE
jgi:hypothetical protein